MLEEKRAGRSDGVTGHRGAKGVPRSKEADDILTKVMRALLGGKAVSCLQWNGDVLEEVKFVVNDLCELLQRKPYIHCAHVGHVVIRRIPLLDYLGR